MAGGRESFSTSHHNYANWMKRSNWKWCIHVFIYQKHPKNLFSERKKSGKWKENSEKLERNFQMRSTSLFFFALFFSFFKIISLFSLFLKRGIFSNKQKKILAKMRQRNERILFRKSWPQGHLLKFFSKIKFNIFLSLGGARLLELQEIMDLENLNKIWWKTSWQKIRNFQICQKLSKIPATPNTPKLAPSVFREKKKKILKMNIGCVRGWISTVKISFVFPTSILKFNALFAVAVGKSGENNIFFVGNPFPTTPHQEFSRKPLSLEIERKILCCHQFSSHTQLQ